MAESLLVMVTKPPYGLEDAFAGLRLGLAMVVNGMKTTVVMVDDGVYNAVATQDPAAVGMPSNIEATTELYDFDVDVYVVREDLAARGLPETGLIDGVKVVPATAVAELVAGHSVTTTF
ncbi:MAG: DsrE family protein [Thermoplasmata archaeon]|nr:DsrE family protein [Thermoplasmata archaeon]